MKKWKRQFRKKAIQLLPCIILGFVLGTTYAFATDSNEELALRLLGWKDYLISSGGGTLSALLIPILKLIGIFLLWVLTTFAYAVENLFQALIGSGTKDLGIWQLLEGTSTSAAGITNVLNVVKLGFLGLTLIAVIYIGFKFLLNQQESVSENLKNVVITLLCMIALPYLLSMGSKFVVENGSKFLNINKTSSTTLTANALASNMMDLNYVVGSGKNDYASVSLGQKNEDHILPYIPQGHKFDSENDKKSVSIDEKGKADYTQTSLLANALTGQGPKLAKKQKDGTWKPSVTKMLTQLSIASLCPQLNLVGEENMKGDLGNKLTDISNTSKPKAEEMEEKGSVWDIAKMFGDKPYQGITINFFPAFFSMIAVIIVMISGSMKVVLLFFELIFQQIAFFIKSPLAFSDSTKATEILKEITETFLNYVMICLSMNLYIVLFASIPMMHLGDNMVSNLFVRPFLYLAIAIFAVKGSKTMKKHFGIDTGNTGALIAGYAGVRGAKAVKNGVQNASEAMKNRSMQQSFARGVADTARANASNDYDKKFGANANPQAKQDYVDVAGKKAYKGAFAASKGKVSLSAGRGKGSEYATLGTRDPLKNEAYEMGRNLDPNGLAANVDQRTGRLTANSVRNSLGKAANKTKQTAQADLQSIGMNTGDIQSSRPLDDFAVSKNGEVLEKVTSDDVGLSGYVPTAKMKKRAAEGKPIHQDELINDDSKIDSAATQALRENIQVARGKGMQTVQTTASGGTIATGVSGSSAPAPQKRVANIVRTPPSKSSGSSYVNTPKAPPITPQATASHVVQNAQDLRDFQQPEEMNYPERVGRTITHPDGTVEYFNE